MFNKKKGVSGVITVVLLISLVLATVAIVWATMQNLVGERLEKATSCSGIFEKISLNKGYTCYNDSSKEMLVSIKVEDVEINKIMISISGGGDSKTIEIPDSSNYTKPYRGDYPQEIYLPGKNAGKTYVLNLTGLDFSEKPTSVIIYPVVKGKKCPASDTILPIADCFLFDL